MDTKHIIRSLIVLGLIIIGMFVFTYIKKTEIQNAQLDATPLVNQTSETEIPYPGITRVDAKHFFIDGVHTIAGELLMPTPCDLLNWDTRVLESMPEQVIIDMKVINNADMCAQQITPQRFMVSFSASSEASIRLEFMERALDLNLIPALPGERPEDFELFIKG